MPRSRHTNLPLGQAVPRIHTTEEAPRSGGSGNGSTPVLETRDSLHGDRNSVVVAPPGGVLLPVGVYNVFCLPASVTVFTGNAPLRGRIVVEQLASGLINESWVMFAPYLPPSPTNTVWIVSAPYYPARTQQELYSETACGAHAAGAICADRRTLDPRDISGFNYRQIDAGTVEIVASTSTGPQRVGQVVVTPPTSFSGPWTTASVNNGQTVWMEEWAVLRHAPQATAWCLKHVLPVDVPQLQAWVNAAHVVNASWAVMYASI
jgi:hypothetical protein